MATREMGRAVFYLTAEEVLAKFMPSKFGGAFDITCWRDDFRVTGVSYDFELVAFRFHVESPSLPVVAPGEMLPILEVERFATGRLTYHGVAIGRIDAGALVSADEGGRVKQICPPLRVHAVAQHPVESATAPYRYNFVTLCREQPLASLSSRDAYHANSKHVNCPDCLAVMKPIIPVDPASAPDVSVRVKDAINGREMSLGEYLGSELKEWAETPRPPRGDFCKTSRTKALHLPRIPLTLNQ